jgi:hypothetical protein
VTIDTWIKTNYPFLINERLAWLKKINARAWYCEEFERLVQTVNDGTVTVTDTEHLGSLVFTQVSEYNQYIQFWTVQGPVYFQPYSPYGPFLNSKKPTD